MLKVYNTLTRKKEEFKPIKLPKVGLYTCGPTVYDYPHIGNYRAYIFGDILKRYLKYSGYAVMHVMNLTDFDDKTIRDSGKAGKTLKEFTEFYSKEFFKDLELLNIEPADVFPKATEHIQEMIEIIEKLLEKEIAYKGEDGSIYFNIKKFAEYGKLAHLEKQELKKGGSGRIIKDEYEKENAQDFALWKGSQIDTDKEPINTDGSMKIINGEPAWPTPWGWGRPGWHIECSAMSMKYLTDVFDPFDGLRVNGAQNSTIDIHTGGVDLIFPHHQNEIAQSEAATGEPFVKYWLHNEWLLVDGKKMAKSAGNFYTLRDIEKKGFSPLAFRYLTLQNHYRTPLNFTWESLEAGQNGLKKIQEHYLELTPTHLPLTKGEVPKAEGVLKYKNRFKETMDDDLGTPEALAIVWELIKDEKISDYDKKATLLDFDKVLGLGLYKLKTVEIPAEIKKLVEEREKYRQSGDFKKSDELREKIKSLGFSVKDTPEGPKVLSQVEGPKISKT